MSHEILALRDLKQLGLSLEQYPEFPSTRSFYQTQYYMIEHVSPWSFWGYILMLEGLALTKGPWMFNEIKQHHGEKAGSFVKVHAAEDVGHMAEAERAMQSLPERYQKIVSLYYSGDMTMREIGEMLGINESRVSQIHKSALEKMQVVLQSNGIQSSQAF